MLIGNIQANRNEAGEIITPSGNTVSEEQIEETTFRVKKSKVEALASKLNTPIPRVNKENVDEILKDLISEANALSIREKNNKDIKAEDTRHGQDEELFVAAGITGNTDIVGQMLRTEDTEDQENQNALKIMDKAQNKNIRVYEGTVINGKSVELDRLENNIAIAETLENKGLNINVDEKSETVLKQIIDKLDNKSNKSDHVGNESNIEILNDLGINKQSNTLSKA
ncbi:MAG: hypothetical protein VKK32_00505 [Candidatus Melainabacteria bacterium]|nr:hypothetical protein [Candidatus Melainabacteria bacterium]